MHRGSLCAACALVALIPPSLTRAADWVNPAGGSWKTASNWDPASVPTADTDVRFDLHSDQSYTVTLPYPAAPAARNLTVNTDQVRLYADDGSIPLAGPILLAPTPGDDSKLSVDSYYGTTLTSSSTAASTLASPGGTASLDLTGQAFLSLAGPLRIADGGTASLLLADSARLNTTDIELATTPNSSAMLDASFTASSGSTGSLAATGSMYVGGSASSPGGIATVTIFRQTVTVAGALKIYDTGPASPAGTRVNLVGGHLSVGALDTSGNLARFNWTGGALALTHSDLTLSPTGPLGDSLTLRTRSNGATDNQQLGVSGTLTLVPGASLYTIGTTPVSAGAIVNAGTLIGSGVHAKSITNTGTLDLTFGFPNLPLGSTLTNSGGTMTIRGSIPHLNASLIADAGQLFLTSQQYFRSIALSGSAAMKLIPGDSSYSSIATQALAINDHATLDLGTLSLIFAYTSATPSPFFRQWIHDGAVISSVDDPNHLFTIGYSDTGLRPVYEGSWVSAKRVPTGDANMNGTIDPDDYALLDRSYARSLSDAFWFDGDFNYDGLITTDDYLLIDRTFAFQSGGSLSPDLLASRQAQFGPPYVSQLLASIPEPTGLAAVLAFPLLTRNRRRT